METRVPTASELIVEGFDEGGFRVEQALAVAMAMPRQSFSPVVGRRTPSWNLSLFLLRGTRRSNNYELRPTFPAQSNE